MTTKKVFGTLPTDQIPNVSFSDYMLEHLRKYSDKKLFVEAETGKFLTNEDILRTAVKLARIFENRGVKLGDRIAVASENRGCYITTICASILVGAVIAPLNPLYTEWELKHILNISKPKIVFVSRLTETVYLKLAKTVPWKMEVIEFDEKPLVKNIPTFKQLLDNVEDVNPYLYKPKLIEHPEKVPLVILCSSGTTGLPKGVALSHRNIVTLLIRSSSKEHLHIVENDKVLLFLPFYHGYAFGLIMSGITTGATLIAMRTFDPTLFLQSIPKYKITHLPVVPPVFIFLAKHPAVLQCDFSSVREMMCGAAPLPRDLVSEVLKRVKLRTVRNGYGMTELTIITNVSSRTDDDTGSVGSPLPGLLCKIIDQDTGEPLTIRQAGEVCFKGDQVMLGYYNNPEVTQQTIDKDGWLHTGDIGYFDEMDRLHIVGRQKELIKYKGYQVSPSEIEVVLLSHPSVKDTAVASKPDEVAGELPMAYVVKQPGSKVTAEEIIAFVKDKLSPQKWLRGGVKFVESIPKNPTGKVLRNELHKLSSKL